MNELRVRGKVHRLRTTEFNMCRMSYGVVVNWGLSKMSELKRSDLRLSVMLFPGWKNAIGALRCQNRGRIYGVCVHQCFFLCLSKSTRELPFVCHVRVYSACVYHNTLDLCHIYFDRNGLMAAEKWILRGFVDQS